MISCAALVAAYTVSGRCSADLLERQVALVVAAVLLGAPHDQDRGIEHADAPPNANLTQQLRDADDVDLGCAARIAARARDGADAGEVEHRVGWRHIERTADVVQATHVPEDPVDGALLRRRQERRRGRRVDRGESGHVVAGIEQGADEPLPDEAGGTGH